ncbi:hypothetical protein FQR65_LT07995 [Abscondita terminalis]|nr:hypothetical protein FQR65_LT07995 [Abscondita terminalis]
MSWAAEEFAGAQLGDKRLNARLRAAAGPVCNRLGSVSLIVPSHRAKACRHYQTVEVVVHHLCAYSTRWRTRFQADGGDLSWCSEWPNHGIRCPVSLNRSQRCPHPGVTMNKIRHALQLLHDGRLSTGRSVPPSASPSPPSARSPATPRGGPDWVQAQH